MGCRAVWCVRGMDEKAAVVELVDHGIIDVTVIHVYDVDTQCPGLIPEHIHVQIKPNPWFSIRCQESERRTGAPTSEFGEQPCVWRGELDARHHRRAVHLSEHCVEKRQGESFEFEFETYPLAPQNFTEDRNALRTEPPIKPCPGVERSDLVKPSLHNEPATGSRSIDGVVVDHDKRPIQRGVDVELDRVDSKVDSAAEPNHRVLGSLMGCPTVTMNSRLQHAGIIASTNRGSTPAWSGFPFADFEANSTWMAAAEARDPSSNNEVWVVFGERETRLELATLNLARC